VAELLGRRGLFFPADSARLTTAQRATELLALLETRDPVELAQVLGTFDPAPSSWAALQRHIQHAGKVAHVLNEDVYFNVFEALGSADRPGAKDLLAQLSDALAADELNVDLAGKLPALSVDGQKILRPAAAPPPPPPQSAAVVGEGSGEGLDGLAAARDVASRALAKAGAGARLEFWWKVTKPR
jgi:hypothetical protein